MKRKKVLIWSLLVCVVALLVNVALAQQIPLPTDIEIVSPPLDLPKEIAAFSGKWKGNWEGDLEAILIVEEIDPQKAKVIYAWADGPRVNVTQGYSRLITSVVSGPNPRIEFIGGGAKFVFKMGKDLKTIKGEREFRGRYKLITMKPEN